MNDMGIKPVFVTFHDLSAAMADLHVWNAGLVAQLHDVWLMGAPSPASIVRNPKGYDPRVQQKGNFEARLILPTKLAEWIMVATAARGMPVTIKQAANIVMGVADLSDV